MQGGVGDCTHELGSALIQLGHEVAVVTSSQVQSPVAGRADADHAGEIAGKQDGVPVAHRVVSRWDWGSWGLVLEQVRALQSDILHIQYQTGGYGMHPAINFLPWHLRRVEKRPRLVATFHDLRVPYLFPKAGAVRGWVTQALARWSDAVIATNTDDYQALGRSLPSHPSLHLIPIGSNIHPQPPPGYDRVAWRRSLGVDEDEALLCYLGFLNESKGGETLFRCLAELRRRGVQAKLLMIGGQVGDSDPTNLAYARRIRALGAELGLQHLVLWTDYVPAEQVSASLLAADICVLPYRDGVSYRRGSFMAALAHGLPIVSTRPRTLPPAAVEQGMSASLVEGDNILLVPADDPLATADAVGRLAATPELRARLKRGALVLARAFTWDRIAARTAQVYQEILRLPAAQVAQDDRGGPVGE